MALVAENGSGLVNANSFATVAEADTFLGDRGYSGWLALTTQTKETALILATDYLNSAYAYIGYRMTTTQALAWPRVDMSNYRMPSGVPIQVKQAVCRIANEVGVNGASLFSTVKAGNLVRRAQAGSVSVEFSDQALSVAASGRAVMPWVDDLLAGLTLANPDNPINGNGFGMVSVVRA